LVELLFPYLYPIPFHLKDKKTPFLLVMTQLRQGTETQLPIEMSKARTKQSESLIEPINLSRESRANKE
jgi:hypothetical protein